MDEYARRTRDLSRRGFCGVVVSFLTSHDLRPLTPGSMQARDDVVRGMLALCVSGSAHTSLLLGKRDKLLAHRQMLALLKERPVCLGIERGGRRLQTLCTSNLSLVPVERWDRLPTQPWPPFRVFDLCNGNWLSFAYDDVTWVRLPGGAQAL